MMKTLGLCGPPTEARGGTMPIRDFQTKEIIILSVSTLLPSEIIFLPLGPMALSIVRSTVANRGSLRRLAFRVERNRVHSDRLRLNSWQGSTAMAFFGPSIVERRGRNAIRD